MFDPIQAPDVHRGPAVGHSTEFDTTWQEAVKRINDAFAELFGRDPAAVDPAIGIPPDFVAALEARFERAEDRIAALEQCAFETAAAADANFRAIHAHTGMETQEPPATAEQPEVVTGSTPA